MNNSKSKPWSVGFTRFLLIVMWSKKLFCLEFKQMFVKYNFLWIKHKMLENIKIFISVLV